MKLFLAYLIAPFFSLFIGLRSAPAYRGALKPYKWYRAALAGRVASDGSPYRVYLKKGSVNKLMIYFSGGGAAWSAETAARPMTLKSMLSGAEAYYFPAVKKYLEITLTGILSPKKNEKNPVSEWNVLYIPYSSGDFHVGNRAYDYLGLDGKQHTIYQHGERNVQAALDALPAEFRDPEMLLIAGESAGGFGCVANAPEIAARFPNAARVVVYADSAQLEHRPGLWLQTLTERWNADARFHDGFGDDTQVEAFWFERIYRTLGDRALLLHSNTVADETLTAFQNKMRNDVFSAEGDALAEFQRGLADAVTRLRKLPTYRFYLSDQERNPKTGLTPHTNSRWARFTTVRSGGLTVAEWLDGALKTGDAGNVGADLLERL